jgi:hypothetical protein
MSGDIEISPTGLVRVLRTAGKPVRDVYRRQGGGYWISFDGWVGNWLSGNFTP